MTRSWWPSVEERMNYESKVRIEAKSRPGVWLVLKRMSFGRRLELTRKVRELLARLEFVSAGAGGEIQQAEKALLASEIDREYLRWGLDGIEGLEIDGERATTEALIERGPEELVHEALEAVRREAGLTEDERKNCESHSTSPTAARSAGNATNAAA
jgi:hypothetical protein